MEKLNIFYQLFKKVYNIYIGDNVGIEKVKPEKECDKGSQKIQIKNRCIILTIGDKCEYVFIPEDIKEIIYSIDLEDEKYFFQLVERAKGVDNNIRFSVKHDIKYKADNIDEFIKDVTNLGIFLSPNVGQYGDFYNKGNAKGLIKYCQFKNKFLITILASKNKLYFCHGIFYRDKNIEIKPFNLLDLEKEFNNDRVVSQNNMPYNEAIDSGIYLLDKQVTMGLGYVIVPFSRVGIHDIYIVNTEKDFFYSNSEKEIKLKIQGIGVEK